MSSSRMPSTTSCVASSFTSGVIARDSTDMTLPTSGLSASSMLLSPGSLTSRYVAASAARMYTYVLASWSSRPPHAAAIIRSGMPSSGSNDSTRSSVSTSSVSTSSTSALRTSSPHRMIFAARRTYAGDAGSIALCPASRRARRSPPTVDVSRALACSSRSIRYLLYRPTTVDAVFLFIVFNSLNCSIRK